ncbi:Serine/threonine-protein kinase, partial [Mortierella sp. AD010]
MCGFSLGSARFMKTIRGRHKEGSVVVKIFVKPEAGFSLKRIAKILNEERESLADVPNAITFQKVLETDRAGYLIRQYFFSSLYDRISTRPFMNLVEKKWVTYQLLKGLADSHARNVYHGDIKTENCLVTSWNWVYLSDFAGYKPTFLPEDNPADFSFFFDTSSRRTCYLAPERFYKPGVDTEKQKQAEDPGNIFAGLTAAMDIFSVGCVIAELFSEGTPIFSLSQMFKYRSGEYDPSTYINKIEDDHIKALIRHMIQLDPSKRLSAEQYLAEWYVTESAGESSNSGAIDSNMFSNTADPTEPRPRTDADEKIERIYNDFDKISFVLGLESPQSPRVNLEGSSKSLSTAEKQATGVKESQYAPNEGALILLSLLCSSMRNTAYPTSRMHALDLLLSIGRHVADDIKLDRLVPYIVSCLSDEVGLVRAHALKTLAKMLDEVETLDVINVTIFPEYILPALHAFPSDKEVLVRSAYAGCIAQFAQTSLRYLELAQLLKNDGAFTGNEGDGDAEGSPYEATYDSALHDLQVAIEDQIRTLLVDSDSSVKRALLSDMTSLCIFLGKQRVDDVLLSHMITYLNGRDWMLRRDEKYLDKLRAIGMTHEDEDKLEAMREYIWKLSRSRQSARPKGREDELDGLTKDGSVDLRKIGITPVTVFLSPDNIEKDYNLSRGYTQLSKSKVYDNTLLHPNRRIVKSSTTGNMSRVPSDNTIANTSRTKDNSSTSIYDNIPFDPSAPGQSGANLYLQSASDRQSTASFASSIAHSTFQSSSYGQTFAHSLPNSPESSRARSSASNIIMDKNSRRTRILLTPGNTVNSETGKAAAATSMNDTNAQGTIELPVNEKTVQDVIAGSGVDIPKSNSPPWQTQFETAYSGDISRHRGSENFGERAFNHTIDGGLRNLSELLAHQTLKIFHSPTHEFGPNIVPLSRHRRMHRNNSQTVRSQWRPKGTLVAHLAEHKASVNQICVSPDHTFFVSCSDDGSVKIWDTARLEKNVANRARMSYNALGGKVTCISFIENTHSVAAASDNGLIHIFRVHYSAGKYGKSEVVRKITLDDEFAVTMEHYNTESQSLLVYATNRGNIRALELGSMSPAWNLKNNISHGVITAMVIDNLKAWLLVGTNRGVLTLWDLRFMIAIRSWVHPSKSRISRLVIHPEHHHPSRGGKVVIASGKNDVSVWDIEHVECCEVFGVRNTDEKKALSFDSFKATEPLSGSELLRNSFTSSDSNVSADQSVHAVIFPGECEYMITGGADRKMRYWDMGRVEISYVISGNDSQDPPPKYA